MNNYMRKITGKVVLSGHGLEKDYEFSPEKDLISFQIERGHNDNTFAGAACAKKYTVKVTGKLCENIAGVKTDGTYTLTPKLAICAPDEDIRSEDYTEYPAGTVYEINHDSISDCYTFVCYDDMKKLDMMRLREVDFEDDNFAQPREDETTQDATSEAVIQDAQVLTLKEYLSRLCKAAGVQYSGKDFFNSNKRFTVNNFVSPSKGAVGSPCPNLSGDETLRYVVGKIAQAALCNAVINYEGKLELVDMTKSDGQAEGILHITDNEYFSYSRKGTAGAFGGVILARTGEDNIYSELEEGKYYLKIYDNPFLDTGIAETDERAICVSELAQQLGALEYFPYELNWRFDPSVKEYDLVCIGGTNTVYMGDTIVYDGSLNAQAQSGFSAVEVTDAGSESFVKEMLRLTQLKVDKNLGEIRSIVNDSDERLSEIVQTSDSINLFVKSGGTNNLLTGSAGFDGDVWNIEKEVTIKSDKDTQSRKCAKIMPGGCLKINLNKISPALNSEYVYRMSFLLKYEGAKPMDFSCMKIDDKESQFSDSENKSNEYYLCSKEIKKSEDGKFPEVITFYLDEGTISSICIADVMLVAGNEVVAWSVASTEFLGNSVKIDSNSIKVSSVEDGNDELSINAQFISFNNGSNSEYTRISDTAIQSHKGSFSQMEIGKSLIINNGNRIMITKAFDRGEK